MTYTEEEVEQIRIAAREEGNNCSCREKWTFGVVHRKDEPCYWPERPEAIPNGSFLQTVADTIKEFGLVREETWPTPRQQERQRVIEVLRGMKKDDNPKKFQRLEGSELYLTEAERIFNQAIDQAIKAVEEI